MPGSGVNPGCGWRWWKHEATPLLTARLTEQSRALPWQCFRGSAPGQSTHSAPCPHLQCSQHTLTESCVSTQALVLCTERAGSSGFVSTPTVKAGLREQAPSSDLRPRHKDTQQHPCPRCSPQSPALRRGWLCSTGRVPLKPGSGAGISPKPGGAWPSPSFFCGDFGVEGSEQGKAGSWLPLLKAGGGEGSAQGAGRSLERARAAEASGSRGPARLGTSLPER